MSELKKCLREDQLARLREDPLWDVVVIGGGATGAGIAVDAASRGLKTLIVDARDFSAGTSSRSTKLVHGGVRYMADVREWGLVRNALRERGLLLQNAPHLVKAKPFILPCYKKGEREMYTLGLGLYGAMTCGGVKPGRTTTIGAEETKKLLPGVKADGLTGGVEFFDAQMDDARLNLALIRTAVEKGATALNYMPVTAVNRVSGMIRSVELTDQATGETYTVRTKVVFNAAGVWVDTVRRMVEPKAADLIRVSRGSHIILDKSFMPGDRGMLIPKTRDGRVLFAIPWHGAVLVGTTDVECKDVATDPKPTEEEIDFMIETASGYLDKPIRKSDVKASFAGLRPLFNPPQPKNGQPVKSTAKVSREHAVLPEFGNMVTVTGGKWTSYRKMAEDAMLIATLRHLIPARLCETATLPIVNDETWDCEALENEACAGSEVDERVAEYAIYARDYEFARTAEDVLYRRLRVGQLNEVRARELMPRVEAALEGREYVPPVEDVEVEVTVAQEVAAPVETSAVSAESKLDVTERVEEPEIEEVKAVQETLVEKKADVEDISPKTADEPAIDETKVTSVAAEEKQEEISTEPAGVKTEETTEVKSEVKDAVDAENDDKPGVKKLG